MLAPSGLLEALQLGKRKSELTLDCCFVAQDQIELGR